MISHVTATMSNKRNKLLNCGVSPTDTDAWEAMTGDRGSSLMGERVKIKTKFNWMWKRGDVLLPKKYRKQGHRESIWIDSKQVMYCCQRNTKNKDIERANKISNRFLPKAIRNAVKRKLNSKSNGILNLRNV